VIALVLLAAEINVGPNVQVSAARGAIHHREVVLAADRSHADRLLACSMLGAGQGRTVSSAAYVSSDGGRTWSAPFVSDEHFSGDPTCAIGADGTFYFATKVNEGKHDESGFASDWDYLRLRRSTDGGRTWKTIPSLHANDRPWMAVDDTNGRYRGRLYIAFEEHVHGEREGHAQGSFRHMFRLITSLDAGESFPYRVDRALLDEGGPTGSNSLACSTVVTADGTVAVLHHHQLTGPPQPTGKLTEVGGWLQLFRSRDGGESVEPAVKIADVKSAYNLPHARGVTGSMAAFKDRLYGVWTDTGSGRAQIMLSSSADGGDTWSPPSRISDDPVEGRPSGGPDHFMPTVAANRDGVVGVMWYDRRDNPDNRGYYARFRASIDGGATWLPSVRVSEAPNLAREEGGGMAGKFLVTGGDTAGLAADAEGRFHALWIDNRTGAQQVWTATITVGPGRASSSPAR
jgi:hypothetical protein